MDVGASLWNFDAPSRASTAIDPATVADLAGYFGTHGSGGYTMGNGSDVAAFIDRAGLCGNATSTSVARRPTLVPNVFGALAGLQFTDTGSTTDSSFQEMANDLTTTEETIFLVMKVPNVMSGTTDYYLANNSTSPSYGISRTDTGFTEFRATGSSANTQALRGAPLMTLDKPIILSAQRSAALNSIVLYENGAELKRDTHTGGARNGKLRFGLLSGATYGTFVLGAAVIIKRYVSEAERLGIEEWLAREYSVYTAFEGIRSLYPTSRRHAARNGITSLNQLPLKMTIFGAGQSGMAGGAPDTGISANLLAPIQGGYIWNPTNNAFEQLTLSNNLAEISDQHGPEMALMYDFGADYPGSLMVKSATGNTSMYTRWNKNGDLYKGWKDRIKAAMDAEGLANGTRFIVAGVPFSQGEFDSDDQTFADAWYTLASEMIADFRATVWGAENAPWSIVKTRLDAPSNPTAYATVRAAQDALAANIPNVFISGPWQTSRGDGIHGDANSIRQIANQMALQFGATTQVAQ